MGARVRYLGCIAIGLLGWTASAQAQTQETYLYDVHGRLTASTQAAGPSAGAYTGYAYDESENRTLRGAQTHGPVLAPDILAPGEQLVLQQHLTSADNRFRFVVQADGNLVVYFGPTPLWQSSTYGGQAMVLIMQGDGNLVLYGPGFSVIWNSGTNGYPGARLVMQSDGNLVIYSGSTPLWWTGTGGL